MNGKSFRQRWRFAASLSVVSISGYFISGWLSPEESHSQDNPAVERFELPSRLLEQERTKVLELQNAGPEQLSEIFRRLAKAEDDDSYNEEGLDSLSLLYPRWAQLEPEGAIRFFQKWSPDGVDDEDEIRHQRNWYLRSFMYQWADIEPLALLKFSRDVADPDLTDVGCHFAMTVIRKRSREEFFALAKALPATIDIRSVYDDAIFELAKEDTEAAMRQLTELPRGSDKILERIRSLSESDELDQDFAANMQLALPKPEELPRGMQRFRAPGQDRLSFLAKRVSNVWSPWLKADLDGATAAYLNRFGTESIDQFIVMGINSKLISAMQARGVVEVLDWGTSNLYGGNIDLCLAPIARKVFLYGGKEGIPALRRYFSLPAKRVQGDYDLINSIPNERLLDLLQIVSELEDQSRTETLRVYLVARLYRIDPVRAEEEIASRQYPEWVWKKIARDQAPDIEAAIIILRKHYPEEDSSPSDLLTGDERFSFPPFDVARQIDHLSRENQEHLVIETVRDMSRVNLRRTIDWAEALEDPALRAYAFRGITKIWARTDPRAASRWLEGIPPGAHRNPAIKIIVHSELPHAQRLEWAQLISDETDRSEGLESLITETHSSIPIERFHSLQALDLPEEQKKKLNRTLFTGEK